MRLLLTLLAALVAGCATTRLPVETQAPVDFESWHMKGRLAVNIGGQGDTASFIWNKSGQPGSGDPAPDQNLDTHEIEIYGPLGTGRVILSQANGSASLKDGKSEWTGQDLETVLFGRTGWLVPFDSLGDWIIGRPSPGPVQDSVYDKDALTGFTQSGWQVSYDRFENNSGLAMPGKITLTATDEYLQQLSASLGRSISTARVKIIIKSLDWG